MGRFFTTEYTEAVESLLKITERSSGYSVGRLKAAFQCVQWLKVWRSAAELWMACGKRASGSWHSWRRRVETRGKRRTRGALHLPLDPLCLPFSGPRQNCRGPHTWRQWGRWRYERTDWMGGVRELGGACKAVFHLLHRISNGGVERGKERGSFWFGTACAVLLGVGRPWWAFTNK